MDIESSSNVNLRSSGVSSLTGLLPLAMGYALPFPENFIFIDF